MLNSREQICFDGTSERSFSYLGAGVVCKG
jgi:hypothetical protein